MVYVRLDPTIIHRAKHPMMASRYLQRHPSVTLKITLPSKFGKALWRNIALRLNFCFFWFLIPSVTPSFSVEHSRPFLWKLAVIQSSYLKSLDLLNPWDQLIADTARELKLTFQRGWLLIDPILCKFKLVTPQAAHLGTSFFEKISSGGSNLGLLVQLSDAYRLS